MGYSQSDVEILAAIEELRATIRNPLLQQTGLFNGTGITSTSPLSVGLELAATGTTFAGGTYTANDAFYIPFRVVTPNAVAYKIAVANGAVASGNVDVGIYDGSRNKLVSSGSTAQAGTTTLQVFDITDTALPMGKYWMAVAIDNATGTMFRQSAGFGAGFTALIDVRKEASAFPLPATATFAAAGTSVATILMGVILRSDWA